MALPFDFDPEKLQSQLDENNQQKKNLALVGGIGDALASGQSFGNFYLGKMNPESSAVSKTAGALSDNIADPLERQAKLYQAYKTAKDAKLSEDEQSPDSDRSKQYAEMIESTFPSLKGKFVGKSYQQMKEMAPILVERARAQADFDNQKQLKALEHGYDMDKERMKLDSDNKNLPQNVYTAATYAQRLEDANKQMDDLVSKNYDPSAIMNQLQQSSLYPGVAMDENNKLMDQAKRNFVNAVLRRESGSAISSTEFDSANKQYFPQAGDTQAVLDQKRKNRMVALAGLQNEGAKALPRLKQDIQNNQAGLPAPAAQKTVVKTQTNTKTGQKRVVYSDGSAEIINQVAGGK